MFSRLQCLIYDMFLSWCAQQVQGRSRPADHHIQIQTKLRWWLQENVLNVWGWTAPSSSLWVFVMVHGIVIKDIARDANATEWERSLRNRCLEGLNLLTVYPNKHDKHGRRCVRCPSKRRHVFVGSFWWVPPGWVSSLPFSCPSPTWGARKSDSR